MIKQILKNPLAIALLSILVVISGIVAALMLPIKLQPHVNAPFLMVSASVIKDVDLDTMEKEAVMPLETLAMSKEIVKDTTSRTTTKGIQMEVLLKDTAKEEEVNKLKEELSQKLNTSSIDFDFRDVRQYSAADNVIMLVAVTSDDLDQEKVRKELKDTVVTALREVPGVSRVDHTLDYYKPVYEFEFKPGQMKSLQHASSIIEELRGSFTSPLLGTLTYGGENYRVRSAEAVSSSEELMQYRFSSGERLTDTANFKVDMQANHSYTMISGKPYYEISVFASEDASEVKISEQVKKVIGEHQANQITKWDYLYAWDASSFIGLAVRELVMNILIGAAIAALLLLVIFRNVRTMLIISLSIPICTFATLLSMAIFGYSINIITLMGIGLGTGMIVDACIVVIENIFRKMQEGTERLEAVVEGTKEVFAPVLSSILTTIAVFVPITFMDGMIGVFMKQLGLTVTVSLVASLVVALTVIPNLAFKMIKLPPSMENKRESRMMAGFEKLLRYALHRRWLTVLSFVLVLIVSLYALIAFVPKSYIPNVSDRSIFIDVEVDEKISYEENMALVDQTAKQLLPIDGVKEVLYYGNDSNTARATFIVLFEDRAEMEQSDEETKEQIKQKIDQLIPYSFLSMGEGQADTAGQMQISVSAQTMEELVRSVPAVRQEISLIPGVTGTEADLTENSKEWVINFSREQLAYHGISKQEVEQYIGLVLGGVQDIDITLDGEAAKASIKFPEVFRQSSDGLYQLPIRSDLNLTIQDVAALTQVDAEAHRSRKNGQYELGITIYFDAAQKEQVVSQVTQLVNLYKGDVQLALAGTQQQQAEGFEKLLIAVGVSLAVVFIILTLQFNRFRLPFLIILSLPFAMIGVAVGFLVTGRVFDIVAMIGIVMLVGIVVNNAIILIDFINRNREHYPDVVSAIVGGAKTRMRPIMTTTLTTIGGLIPMFIGGTETSAFQTPLATAVMFGLTFHTFVSLVLVPVMYYIVEGRQERRLAKQARKQAVANI